MVDLEVQNLTYLSSKEWSENTSNVSPFVQVLEFHGGRGHIKRGIKI